jgi:hypothetical protein
MATTTKKKAVAVSEPSAFDEDSWRAESDLRTLVEAAKIRKDPKRMAAVRKKEAEMRAAMAEATRK